MIRRPPRSTRTDTPCPYTTLFRSQGIAGRTGALDARVVAAEPHRKRRADHDVEALGPIHPVLTIKEAADPFDRTRVRRGEAQFLAELVRAIVDIILGERLERRLEAAEIGCDIDRKSTRLNYSQQCAPRMTSPA